MPIIDKKRQLQWEGRLLWKKESGKSRQNLHDQEVQNRMYAHMCVAKEWRTCDMFKKVFKQLLTGVHLLGKIGMNQRNFLAN